MKSDDNGIIELLSRNSFAETMHRLESTLDARGIKIFARIDFSGDAERAGLKMNPTGLLIFGNPKAGTPLMIAAPTLALDLPLKVLVSEDGDGKVMVSYNSPAYLRDRHGIPEELLKNITVISSIVEFATA